MTTPYIIITAIIVYSISLIITYRLKQRRDDVRDKLDKDVPIDYTDLL